MAQQVKTGGKSKTKNATLLPPDRKKYDEEITSLDQQIKEKVAALEALGRPGLNREAQNQMSAQREKLYSDVSKVRSEKDSLVEKRRVVDDEIRQVNDVISKKYDESSKLSAALRYKTIDRVDEALQRLERRKQKQQLSAQEETDIETEIAELTSSKESISSYNQSREDVEKERSRHSDLRKERDSLSDQLSKLRLREDDLRTEQDKMRSRTDKDKQQRKAQHEQHDNAAKELDALYALRKEKHATFRQMTNDFHLRELNERDAAMAKRDEERRKAREERAMERVGRQKEQLEIAAATDPNLTHRQTCQSLISYLQRISVAETNGTASSGSADAASPADVDSLTPVRGAAATAKPGAFLQRKTAEDSEFDSFYAGLSKGKKGKRGKKAAGGKAASRLIKHHSLVLDQFLSIGVASPSTQANIPTTLQTLKEKEAELTRQLVEKHGDNAGIDASVTSDAAATPVVVNGDSAAPESAAAENDAAVTPVCNGDA